jgi:hypothetical protein
MPWPQGGRMQYGENKQKGLNKQSGWERLRARGVAVSLFNKIKKKANSQFP